MRVETYLITKDFDLTVTPMAHAGVPRILERVDLQVERKTLWKKKRKEKNIYLALDLDLGHRWETAGARAPWHEPERLM